MVTRSNGNLLFEGGLAPRGGLNQYFVPGTSPSMRALELSIADIAPTDIPVLLVGESGTGKEVIALEIHRLSERSNGIFVKCGCAGLTAESLIARLNSGERGTGDGETASGSLFLDEVGNLDLASQSRLLDMLADGQLVQPRTLHEVVERTDERYYDLVGSHPPGQALGGRQSGITRTDDHYVVVHAVGPPVAATTWSISRTT